MKSIFILLSALILLSSCNPKPQQEAGAKYKTLRVEFSDRTLKTGYTASLRGLTACRDTSASKRYHNRNPSE